MKTASTKAPRPRRAQPASPRTPAAAAARALKRQARARWTILRLLEAGGAIGLKDALLTEILADLRGGAAPADLRHELACLSELGLIETGEGAYGMGGFARLTAAGRDVVAYRTAAPAGLARPPRRQ